MRIKEIAGTSTFAWSSDVVPLLATASVAGAIDLDFSAASKVEIWDIFSNENPDEPVFSATTDSKFHALAWSRPFASYTRGVLVAALETGEINVWDADKLIKTKSLLSASVHKSSKHSGAIKTLAFHPLQNHVLASGGHHGEIFIWDLSTLADPVSPGRAISPMDEISSVAWNNSVPHILASTSNGGYTSIWDLKAKKEVLHLLYNGPLGKADFSSVIWHPTQSTKLITASQSDACPLIMSWDLRNASEPENILEGHEKGVLSLDWCKKDPNLLISSGKDNSTKLWNPNSAIVLGEYPTAANWVFLSKFAPSAPDVLASASFDGKIQVQTLQDTSPPLSKQTQSNNEDEFWSSIASSNVQQPSFTVKQAPKWLQRPCSASFGFGSKLVSVKMSGSKSNVSVTTISSSDKLQADDLNKAFQENDFSSLISTKLEQKVSDSSDWELLDKLAKNGKAKFLGDIVEGSAIEQQKDEKPDAKESAAEGTPEESEDLDDLNEDSFFENLSKDIKGSNAKGDSAAGDADTDGYVPKGPFKLLSEDNSEDQKRLTRLILNNKISSAVSECLSQGKLLEAFVLALDQDDSIKTKVKNAFFNQSEGDSLSRLIYSASSKSVLDVVANADISNWKEIASSISAFCTDKNDFNSSIVELGDRLLASGQGEDVRENALKCYLAGEALDKVSAIWIKELPSLDKQENKDVSTPYEARFFALRNFLEKLLAYRSISSIDDPLTGPAIEPARKAVFEFSQMAANNGSFDVAIKFLDLLPEDFAGLKTEKERIIKATTKGVAAPSGKSADMINNNSNNSTNISNNRRRVPAAATTSSRTGSVYGGKSVANGPKLVALMTSIPGMNANPSPPAASAVRQNSYTPTVGGHGGPNVPAPPVNPYARASTPNYTPAAPAASFTPAAPPAFGQPNFGGAPAAPAAPVAATGPVPPPAMPNIASSSAASRYAGAPAPARSSIVSPPPVGPSRPSFKQDTDGWNDLPDSFKAKTAARRGAPAAAAVSSPAPPAAVMAPATPAAPPQPAGPPRASAYAPPPPKASTKPSSGATTPTVTQSPRMSSSASSKYAPPPSSILLPPQNGGGAPTSQVSTPVAPPRNPYAPQAVMSPPVHSVAPPAPGSNFAPARPAAAATPAVNNPYAPPAATAAPSTSVPVAPPSNPYAPPPPPTSGPLVSKSPKVLPPPVNRAGSGYMPSPPLASRSSSAGGMPPPPPISRASQALLSSPIGPPPVKSAVAPPPVSAPPKSGSLVAPPPVKAAAAENTKNEDYEVIHGCFDKLLNEIKPAAPAKYAKHVADMEKRLKILFDELNTPGKLSSEVVGSLKGVVEALQEKKWGEAASINTQIQQVHAEEAGAWHVGVKRLITMTEAFEK